MRVPHLQGVDERPLRSPASRARRWYAGVLALALPTACSTVKTVEFDLSRDLNRELDRALEIVEKSVPLPHPEKYKVRMAPLPVGKLGHFEIETDTILLSSRVLWAVWEDTSPWETRHVFDPATVIAHEIACHDPDLPLQHHELGWLTGPVYQPVRRINKYDHPRHNGAQIRVRECGITALVEVRGPVEVTFD